jgi:hypothetical protein
MERKNICKKVEDIYHRMELVIRKKVKYVLLKMSTFYNKYLWALMKSHEIRFAWLVPDFISSKEVKLGEISILTHMKGFFYLVTSY